MPKGRSYAKEVMFHDFTVVKKSGHIRTQPNRHKVIKATPGVAKRGKK